MTNKVARTHCRHYWITGAGSGIGQALTLRLADQGHRIYVSGRNIDKLEKLSGNNPENIIPLPCDVSNDSEMLSLLQNNNIDRLDTVIICAGVCEYIDMPNLDISSIRRVAEINFFGVVNTCKAALPALKNGADRSYSHGADSKATVRGSPHIIGIGSMSSYVGFPRAEAYGASKAAMSYFLHSLRSDIGDKVKVTVVYPGFVETPLTAGNDFPMPFMISADKAADIILAKAEKRPLTITFPRRLHVLLSAMQFFSGLWYLFLVPRLSRKDGKNS